MNCYTIAGHTAWREQRGWGQRKRKVSKPREEFPSGEERKVKSSSEEDWESYMPLEKARPLHSYLTTVTWAGLQLGWKATRVVRTTTALPLDNAEAERWAAGTMLSTGPAQLGFPWSQKSPRANVAAPPTCKKGRTVTTAQLRASAVGLLNCWCEVSHAGG